MKKALLFSVAACVVMEASTLHTLFDALKKQPVTRVDEVAIELAKLQKQKIEDKLYPSLNLFASYEYYDHDTNLRPVPPPEANRRIAHSQALPFAKNIQRLGAMLSMPLFVKELFTLQDKVSHLIEAAKFKKELDIYKNEAVIVGAYANVRFIQELQKALFARKKSLLKTYEDLQIKVQSGRAAPITLDKIESALEKIDIAIAQTKAKEAALLSQIEALTGVQLQHADPITQRGEIEKSALFALKPLKERLQASQKDIQAKKEQFLPKLLLEAKFSQNYAQHDVMFDKSIDTEYGQAAVKLVIPLSKEQFTDIEIAKTNLLQESENYAKVKMELQAQASSLEQELKAYKHMQKSAQKRVEKEKELLRYAKEAFNVGRLTEEEYLRYEDALLEAIADLEETKAKIWQTVAKLAVLYGNDLERIVE